MPATKTKRTRKPRRNYRDGRTEEGYAEAKRYMSRYNRDAKVDVQEVGEPAKIKNPRRRNRCRLNLKSFLTTYLKHKFPLKFSPSHELLIDVVERAVLEGTQQLIVYPRGSGKTTVARASVLWALMYGHRKFPFLFAADDTKARQHIDAIKRDLYKNPLFGEDFPELLQPIRHAENTSQRAKYQKYHGEHTGLVWGADAITLPDYPPTQKAGNAGGILGTGTITGSSRGVLVDDTRPDFVFIDDPQTRASAKSKTQVQDRVDIVNGDIMGLAGPGKEISAVMTATVIYQDDLAHQFLDPETNPEWGGIRISMLGAWPTNVELWEQWNDIRVDCLQHGQSDLARAHKFYRKNRKAMDAGAEVYWADRVDRGYVSAIESAMSRYYQDKRTFASEYQNEPLDLFEDAGGMPSMEELRTRESVYPRRVIPDWGTMLVAMIDVQKNVLYYGVKAMCDGFTGSMISYGTWPDQGRQYYNLADCRKTIFRAKPGAGYEGALHHALHQCMNELENAEYFRLDGTQMTIDKGLVDAQYGNSTDIVYQVCHERGANTPWIPSHGKGITAKQKVLNDRPPKRGEQRGPNWYIPALDIKSRPVRHVNYDTNWWKTFAAERWSTAVPEVGSQTMHKDGFHRIYYEHLHAEYAMRVKTEARTALEWLEKPTGKDNHFFDIDVGCYVAASIAGLKMKEMKTAHSTTNNNLKPITRADVEKRFR